MSVDNLCDCIAGSPAEPVAFRHAFEAYVLTRWGGWTSYAKVHTQATGAADRAAFLAAWQAKAVKSPRL